MIVTCEKCFTKYAVPDDSVGIMGRNVKCAKCGYSWLQMQENVANVNTQATMLLPPKEEEKVAEQPAKSVPLVVDFEPSIYLKIIPVAAIFVSLILVLILYKDDLRTNFSFLDNLYDKLHVYSSNGLSLDDFEVSFEASQDGKENVNLVGYIVNLNETAKHLPDIKISVLDESSEVIAEHIIKYDGVTINSRDKVPVTNLITNLPTDAKNIRLEFFDRLDQLF